MEWLTGPICSHPGPATTAYMAFGMVLSLSQLQFLSMWQGLHKNVFEVLSTVPGRLDLGIHHDIISHAGKWCIEAFTTQKSCYCSEFYLHPGTYAVLCLVTQMCLTLCNPMDCSPPGSSVHGDSPGKNTGVGCHALLQGTFPTQGSTSTWLFKYYFLSY